MINIMEDILIKHLGSIPSNRGNFTISCPVCGKKKLNINIEKGVFNCPYCNTGGGYMKLNALFCGYDPDTLSKEELRKILRDENICSDKSSLKKKEYYITKFEERKIDFEKLDKAYRVFFKTLSLSYEDFKELQSRGLTDFSRYRSYEGISVLNGFDRDTFSEVGGFFEEDGKIKTATKLPGILFPYVNIRGQIIGFQIRSRKVDFGSRYIFFSSNNVNGISSVSGYGVIGNIDGNSKIIITEGALKADASRQLLRQLGEEDVSFIAIPGVNSTKLLFDDLEEFKKRGVKKLYIAFDMDKLENIHVQKALDSLSNTLVKNEFEVEVINWDRRYKGYDDYLLAKLKKKVE